MLVVSFFTAALRLLMGNLASSADFSNDLVEFDMTLLRWSYVRQNSFQESWPRSSELSNLVAANGSLYTVQGVRDIQRKQLEDIRAARKMEVGVGVHIYASVVVCPYSICICHHLILNQLSSGFSIPIRPSCCPVGINSSNE
jgi:hypothetical protein